MARRARAGAARGELAEEAVRGADGPEVKEMAKETEQAEAGEELEFGTSMCRCPNCGATVPHTQRGIPCSKRSCPNCGAAMRGTQCSE